MSRKLRKFKADRQKNRRLILEYCCLERRAVLDASGLVTSDPIDVDGDGQFDQISSFSQFVDDAGWFVSISETRDFSNPDILLSQYTYKTLIDEQGNAQLGFEEVDVDGDGVIDSISHTAWSYDDTGRVSQFTFEQDNDGDGIWDSRHVQTSEYLDSYGSYLSTTTYDDDANEVTDRVETYTYTMDESGLLISQVYDVDENGDGVIDFSEVQYTWDGGGGSDDGGAGNSGSGDDGSGDGGGTDGGDGNLIEYQYDDQGRVVSVIGTQDFDADGIADYSYVISYAFDSAGNQVSSTLDEDLNADGVNDSRTDETFEYLVDGQVSNSTYQVDSNADGVVDYSRVVTYQFDNDGVLSSMLEAIDENGDGIFDQSNETVFNREDLGGGNDLPLTPALGGDFGSDFEKASAQGNDVSLDSSLLAATWQLQSPLTATIVNATDQDEARIAPVSKTTETVSTIAARDVERQTNSSRPSSTRIVDSSGSKANDSKVDANLEYDVDSRKRLLE